MNEGNFIRILYSTQHFILNGIYLFINLQDITCEKFYSKYKCNFNISVHKEIIDKLKQIEEQLLKKYNTNKMASYKIYEQLKSGFIKIFTDVGNRSQCSFILKISGIWETQYNYGLTYKFLKVS
jgi:Zn-dependent M16 (insulinase) family peptidase